MNELSFSWPNISYELSERSHWGVYMYKIVFDLNVFIVQSGNMNFMGRTTIKKFDPTKVVLPMKFMFLGCIIVIWKSDTLLHINTLQWRGRKWLNLECPKNATGAAQRSGRGCFNADVQAKAGKATVWQFVMQQTFEREKEKHGRILCLTVYFV